MAKTNATAIMMIAISIPGRIPAINKAPTEAPEIVP